MPNKQNASIWARLILYILLIDLLVIVIAISGRMLLDWPPLSAFYPFFYGTQLGLGLALLAFLQVLFGLVKKQQNHVKFGGLALLLALSPLLLSLMVVGVAGFKAPMIHDITTDMNDPPGFSITSSLRTAEENSLDYAGESIASEQRRAFPEIQPLFSTLEPQAAQAKALKTVKSLGWVLVLSDEASGTIEAYDKSSVFGFIDDVAIRISAGEDGSRVDMRSVSRVGVGDLGANARRIGHFFESFAE